MSTAAAAPSIEQLSRTRAVHALRYTCHAQPGDPVTPEQHTGTTLAVVERGSFGYVVEGKRHELVAGSVLLGVNGREYACTHEHRCGGDVCLSFEFDDGALDDIAGAALLQAWRAGSLPPLAHVMVAAVPGQSLDETGLSLAAKVVELVDGRAIDARVTPADRRRAVRAAERIERDYAAANLDVAALAADAGVSAFHFLRTFTRVIGASPHQYLVRTRLRAAARALRLERERAVSDIALDVGFGDVSGFTRAFTAAAGVSPRRFRAS